MNEIKNIDKEIHNIKGNNNLNNLEKLNKNIEKIDKTTTEKLLKIIDNLLEKLNQNNQEDKQKIEIFNRMKETLKNDPEEFDFKEFNMMLGER